MDNKKKDLIADWHRRCRQSQRLNYVTGNMYLKFHYIVGVISIIISTIVSSTFFAQISQQSSVQQNNTNVSIMTYIGGFLSISVGILSALQTFFRFSEKSEKYKMISAKYGAIRRQLEHLMSKDDISKIELERQLEIIRKSMDDLAINSLSIPARIKKNQIKDLESKKRKNKLFSKYDGKDEQK